MGFAAEFFFGPCLGSGKDQQIVVQQNDHPRHHYDRHHGGQQHRSNHREVESFERKGSNRSGRSNGSGRSDRSGRSRSRGGSGTTGSGSGSGSGGSVKSSRSSRSNGNGQLLLENGNSGHSGRSGHSNGHSGLNGHNHNGHINYDYGRPYGNYYYDHRNQQLVARTQQYPPTIHEMEEAIAFTNIGQLAQDQRRNGNHRSHRRDDQSVMGASLSETYLLSQGDDHDGDEDDDGGGGDGDGDGDEDGFDFDDMNTVEEKMVRMAVKNSLRDNRNKKGEPNGRGGGRAGSGGRGGGSQSQRQNDRQSESEMAGDSRPHSRSRAGRNGDHPNRGRHSKSQNSELTLHREKHGGEGDSDSDSDDETDFDNVTTISKASINPYHLLGISTSASPREIYEGYKRKLKETGANATNNNHATSTAASAARKEHGIMDEDGDVEFGCSIGKGDEEKAFRDIENAYRRLKAELRRREVRMEQKRVSREKETEKARSNRTKHQQRRRNKQSSEDDDSDSSGKRQSIDARLRDHRALVHDLFAKDAKEQRNDPQTNTQPRYGKHDKKKKLSSNSSVTTSGKVTTLDRALTSQSRALSELNLVPIEAGATNVNERNETITNSCFYLSLAASYLSGSGGFGRVDPTVGYYRRSQMSSPTRRPSKNVTNNGADPSPSDDKSIVTTASDISALSSLEMPILPLPPHPTSLTRSLALKLKRAIEAAVLLVHPDWASTGVVGEEVQAFSDFLVYALDSDSVLGHWAIAVFDEASGFVDVYRGRHYGKVYPPVRVRSKNRENNSNGKGGSRGERVKWRYKDCDEATKRANTLTLRYIPGHYQPLLPELTRMADERRNDERRKKNNGSRRSHNNHHGLTARPNLEDIVKILDKCNVLHVVTDGRG